MWAVFDEGGGTGKSYCSFATEPTPMELTTLYCIPSWFSTIGGFVVEIEQMVLDEASTLLLGTAATCRVRVVMGSAGDLDIRTDRGGSFVKTAIEKHQPDAYWAIR
jgi:hypothetical protein